MYNVLYICILKRYKKKQKLCRLSVDGFIKICIFVQKKNSFRPHEENIIDLCLHPNLRKFNTHS